MNECQERNTQNTCSNEMTFAVGDKELLLIRHLNAPTPSMKLDYQRTGQYKVSQIINQFAYKLDIPSTIQNHNIVHVSLRDCSTPPGGGQPSAEPHRMIVEETEVWELDRILNSRRRYRTLHCRIHYDG